MKILIISRYFYPHHMASALRILSVAESFSEKNHKVLIFTGSAGKKEVLDKNITVKRTNTIFGRKNLVSNILSQTVFLAKSILETIASEKDILIVDSSFPLMGLAGVFSGKKFILVIADNQIGYMEKKKKIPQIIASLLKRLRNFFIEKSAATVVTTETLKKTLVKNGASREKIEIIHNESNTDIFYPEKKAMRKKENKIIYSGSLGIGHDVKLLISIAEKLKGTAKFEVFCNSDNLQEINRSLRGKKITNITIRKSVASEKLREAFWKAKAGIEILENNPVFDSVLSRKVLDYMATGLPVIFVGSGETGKLVRESGAGIELREKNPEQIAQKIASFLSSDKSLREKGRKGAFFAKKHFSKKSKAREYVNLAEKIVSERI